MNDYKDSLSNLSKLPKKKLNSYIRKQAVSNTKKNLISNGKNVKDMPWDQIKELVAAEEKSIVSDMKSKGLLASAGMMALNFLNPLSIAKSFIFDESEDELNEDEFDLADNEEDDTSDAEETNIAEVSDEGNSQGNESSQTVVASKRTTKTFASVTEETIIAAVDKTKDGGTV